MAAKKDMMINADGNIEITNAVEDGNEISAGDALVLNGENVTVAGGLKAGNGFAVTAADTATINAATLDNGVITAGNKIVIDQKDAAAATTDSPVAEGVTVDVSVNAPKVAVSNGEDVTLYDLYNGEEATILNIGASNVVTLSSVSDMQGAISADTLVINGARNATFGALEDEDSEFVTIVNKLAVFGVTGTADITNSGDINVLESSLPGNLVVTAEDANIIVADATIRANDVDFYADINLNLEYANIIAANNFTAGAAAINVEGENAVSAGNIADFTAAVEGEGDLSVIADTALFNDVVDIAGKFVASGDQVVLNADVTAGDEIDFRGVNQTLANADITLTADKIYFNDMSATSEATTFDYAVVIDGEAFAYGDVKAKDVTFTGDIHVMDNITILAAGGSASIGTTDENMVVGSYDLTIRAANDITVNGLVEVKNFSAYAGDK